jgi:dolichyl-phosphate beta-glucosyltransferase
MEYPRGPVTDISVVVPSYKEAETLPDTLAEITQYLSACSRESYEIIVVDDGSKDETVRVVTEQSSRDPRVRLLVNDVNRGKGYSVKRGMLAAKGEYVLFTDADLSTPIGEFEKLLSALKQGFDVAIGSRALPESDVKVHQPFYREFSGKSFNLLMRLVTGLPLRDTQCGFKLFRKNAAAEIFKRQTLDRFSFDVEDLYIAKKRGCRIKEVPVIWVNSESTTVSFLKDSVRMFTDLLQIRINDLRGKYR